MLLCDEKWWRGTMQHMIKLY